MPEKIINKGAAKGKTADGFRSVIIWDLLAVVCLTAAITIGGYALYVLFFVPRTDIAVPVAKSSVTLESSALSSQEWQSFDSYSPAFAERDIFKTDAEKILEAAQVPAAEIGSNTTWGQGYQLSGVIVDQEPRAVIRVLSPLGTQVLSVGDKLDGAELIKIEENQVLFKYQNQTITLNFDQNGQK